MSLTRFIFASDLHGDKQDKNAVQALLAATESFKPHHRIFGGDLVDARPLRRGAGAEERAESMVEDWQKALGFLTLWQPTHLLMGNHDKRLYDLAEAEKGIESDFAWKGVNELEGRLKKLKCKWRPYRKNEFFEFGELRMVHGFYAGVYASRQMAQVFGNVLYGHTHAIDEHSVPGIERRIARGAGCLCSLDMDWNSHMPNSLRHAHGFILGVYNQKTGRFWTMQCEEVDGLWVIPENLKTS